MSLSCLRGGGYIFEAHFTCNNIQISGRSQPNKIESNTANKKPIFLILLTHIREPGVLFWDIGKQHSPRFDTAERGDPFEVILFAQRNFIKK